MSLFQGFPAGEFTPLFRLLDDYAGHVGNRSSFSPASVQSSLRSFQPRFDVKELKEAYELHGELPGVDQKDISIEFSDSNTISIKGRTERHREEGTRPTGTIEGQTEQGRITEGDGNGYHHATVEDENNASGAVAVCEKAGGAAESAANATESGETQVAQQQKTRTPRYWVSERSVGTFARSFSFPDRVDQDNVKASLKDGILSIVVPKASAPATRRINIE